MADTLNPVATLAALPLTRKDRRPGQGSDETNVSRAIGLTRLGASYFVVRPGESAFPYHVHYGEDELSLEIVDDGEGGQPGEDGGPGGHGLVGMRERVHLCGGQFTAGPLPGRGFRVAAVLPRAGGPR